MFLVEGGGTAGSGAPMIALSTYLLLDGTCQEAMEFHRSCLGGELSVARVGDTPMKRMYPPR